MPVPLPVLLPLLLTALCHHMTNHSRRGAQTPSDAAKSPWGRTLLDGAVDQGFVKSCQGSTRGPTLQLQMCCECSFKAQPATHQCAALRRPYVAFSLALCYCTAQQPRPAFQPGLTGPHAGEFCISRQCAGAASARVCARDAAAATCALTASLQASMNDVSRRALPSSGGRETQNAGRTAPCRCNL